MARRTYSYPRFSSLPIWLLCATTFFAGAAIAGATMAMSGQQRLKASQAALQQATVRIGLLESYIRQSADNGDPGFLGGGTATPETALASATQPLPSPVLAAAPAVNAIVARPEPAAANPPRGRARELAPATVAQPAVASPAPTAAVNTAPQRPASSGGASAAAPAPAPVVAVRPERVAAAAAPAPAMPEAASAPVANLPVEVVASAKARVAKVDAGGVTMLSGKRINVGERFDSGEQLLGTDPANNTFTTNQRKLVIM